MASEFDEDTFFDVSEKRIELFKERTRLNEIIASLLTSVSMVELLTSEKINFASVLQFLSGILIKSNWNKNWHFVFGALVSLQPVIRAWRGVNSGGIITKNEALSLSLLFCTGLMCLNNLFLTRRLNQLYDLKGKLPKKKT